MIPRYIRFLIAVAALAAAMVACRNSGPVPPDVPLQGNALKLLVAESGIYRVTGREISEALGVDNADLSKAAITTGGDSVAVLVEGDALLFYGQAPVDRYLAARPYVLSLGEAGAARIADADKAQVDSSASSSVERRVHFEENHVYKSSAYSPETEEAPWFWETIQVGRVISVPLSLPAATDGSGELTLRLYGSTTDYQTELDHDLDVVINDRRVATVQWDGETYHSAIVPLPAGTLQPGDNTLVLDNQVEGATFLDIMQLDWLEVSYAAEALAEADRLALPGDQAGTIALRGFSSGPVVFDVAAPLTPTRLPTEQTASGDALVTLGREMELVAAGPNGFMSPLEITPLRDSEWRETGSQADLIIITTDELTPPLRPLVEAREAQGLTVALLPVEEVYDQFGHGGASPESIKALLQFAVENWADPKPRYLHLVGEATYDYQDYLGKYPRNVVPSMLTPVAFSGETVSDARLADVDGDGRPDLAVGRWPVSDPEAVANLVARTLAYEAGTASTRAIFTADGTSPEFSGFTDRVLNSTSFPAEQIVRMYGANVEDVTEEWNNGAWLVSYTGHGSTDMWGKDDVFTSEAVPELSSNGSAPPLVVQFTCLSGFFAHPEVESISETLLAHEDGPVLIVAATSLTLSTSQEPFADELLAAFLDPSVERIGDALNQAKAALDLSVDSLREISDTFGLLGDPAARIVRPVSGAEG